MVPGVRPVDGLTFGSQKIAKKESREKEGEECVCSKKSGEGSAGFCSTVPLDGVEAVASVCS